MIKCIFIAEGLSCRSNSHTRRHLCDCVFWWNSIINLIVFAISGTTRRAHRERIDHRFAYCNCRKTYYRCSERRQEYNYWRCEWLNRCQWISFSRVHDQFIRTWRVCVRGLFVSFILRFLVPAIVPFRMTFTPSFLVDLSSERIENMWFVLCVEWTHYSEPKLIRIVVGTGIAHMFVPSSSYNLIRHTNCFALSFSLSSYLFPSLVHSK